MKEYLNLINKKNHLENIQIKFNEFLNRKLEEIYNKALKNNIFECWDILLGLFGDDDSITVNHAKSAVMSEPCFEKVAAGTVSNQIMSALRGGVYNKGVTLKYVFDHSATKNKHIIKKRKRMLSLSNVQI